MTVFPDTNVLIHFEPIENWDRNDIYSGDYNVALSEAVIFELDKLKYASNLTQASRHRTSQLLKKYSVSKDYVFNSIQFIIVEYPINIGDYVTSLGLDRESKDDLFLASVINYQNENPGEQCVVITNDFGVKLKCKNRNIVCLSAYEKYQINELDENTKLIRKISAERDNLKNLQPKLSLKFDNNEAYQTFIITQPTTDYESRVNEEMNRIKEAHLYIDSKAEESSIFDIYAKTPEKVASYNAALDNFYRDYELYLKRRFGIDYKSSLTIQLDFDVVNAGNTPGEDVSIKLHFPDGFSMFDEKSYNNSEKIPSPPRLSSFGMARHEIADYFNAFPSVLSLPLSNFSIQRTNSYDVKDNFPKIKHHHRYSFNRLYVLFDSFESVKGFQITYQITAANMVEKVQGALNVIIERKVWSDDSGDYIVI